MEHKLCMSHNSGTLLKSIKGSFKSTSLMTSFGGIQCVDDLGIPHKHCYWLNMLMNEH